MNEFRLISIAIFIIYNSGVNYYMLLNNFKRIIFMLMQHLANRYAKLYFFVAFKCKRYLVVKFNFKTFIFQ